jgi:sugar-specific transcriptional regulator TrmB
MELNAAVNALTHLGLTSSQATVYLTLIRLGTANAQTISNYSHVARSDVYRIIAALEKLALVEKIISTPCKFRPIPIQDSLSILMKRRMNETFELQTVINEVLKHFENNNIRTALEENEHQFILMSEQAGKQQRRKALATVQRSRDGLAPWKTFVHNMPSSPIEEFHRALQRGVEFRIITDMPSGRKNKKLVADTIKHLKKYPNFKIRHLPSPPKATMLVYDQKDAWIFCGAQAGRKEGYDLYTNNPAILLILHDYFENLWMTAIEDKKNAK